MDALKSLNDLFEQKLFRIPDYQRGYAWQKSHLQDLWNDILLLPEKNDHYTGTIMLQNMEDELSETDKEYWLTEQDYKRYYIVDGQQRIVTVLLLLQALIEFLREQNAFEGKSDEEIFISEGISLKDVADKFLFKTKDTYRSYKFSYSDGNLADEFFRHDILDEEGSPQTSNTFYTLNMTNAKKYFATQIANLYKEEGKGMAALTRLYTILTEQLKFDKRILGDEFNVNVAFETINNRGKDLSNFELLKNRLAYLVTLLPDVDSAGRQSLQDRINDTWKEVYKQLGRNENKLYGDDGFLWDHWHMYFYFLYRDKANVKEFLLNEHFTANNVHSKALKAEHIKHYLDSLKESAKHWFNQHAPYMAQELSNEEQDALDRLNRIGGPTKFLPPLTLSISMTVKDEATRIDAFNSIERYQFLVFGLHGRSSSYRKDRFTWYAYRIFHNKLDIAGLKARLLRDSAFCFKNHTEPVINHNALFGSLDSDGAWDASGSWGVWDSWFSWGPIKYFLQEYEKSIVPERHSENTRNMELSTSTEHIYPTTVGEDSAWREKFTGDNDEEDWWYHRNSLGNLLLLPQSVNSSIGNKPFGKKKETYKNGSYSEQEVAGFDDWTPKAIRERGIKLLKFMAERWNFEFENDDAIDIALWLTNRDA